MVRRDETRLTSQEGADRGTNASRKMSRADRLALAAAAAIVAFVVPIAFVKLSPIDAEARREGPTTKVVTPKPKAPPAAVAVADKPTPWEQENPAGAVLPALTASQVRLVVGRERYGVQQCYERAVRAREVTGEDARLVVRAQVEPSGFVSTVSVTPAPSSLRRCIIAVVQGWAFPPSASRSVPEIPFFFRFSTKMAALPRG